MACSAQPQQAMCPESAVGGKGRNDRRAGFVRRQPLSHPAGRRRYPWAELLQRAFGIEVLVCPKCSGIRRVLAAIHDPASIARVLVAMGLSSAVPEQAGCRAPPAGDGLDAAADWVAD